MKTRNALLATAVGGVLVLATAVPAAAAVTVVSVTDTPSAAPLTVDGATANRTFDVAPVGTVSDVTVTIDFLKSSSACPDSSEVLAYAHEVGFTLVSPSGTSVELVHGAKYTNVGATYNSVHHADRVQVTFDDAAAAVVGSTNDALPETGTFRPANPLSAFDGTLAHGTWTLQVSDAATQDPLCYFGATLNVGVLPVPVLSGGALPDAVVGLPYSTQLQVVSGSSVANGYQIVSTTEPGSLQLDSSTGILSGPFPFAGDYEVKARAQNADGWGPVATYSLRVTAPAMIIGVTDATATVGQAFTYTPAINAGYPATAQVSLTGDLPDGLSLNPSTGAITGTPADLAGAYPVTLTISNGVGTPAQLPVTITVQAGAVAAITLSPSVATVDQGATQAFTIAAVDSAGNPTTVSANDVLLSSSISTDQISGLSVTFPDGAVRTITATHTPSGATDDATVTVNAPASITGGATATATVGEAFSYTPTINAGYPATGQVSLTGDLPDGLSLNPSTGAITGTSTGLAGAYPVTLTISNGVGTAAQLPVTITVQAGAVATITLSPSTTTVVSGDPVTFTVTGADSAGNPTAVDAADVTLTSSVTTDQISGLTVTFPDGAVHTITATHTPSGATDDATVTVNAPATITGVTTATATVGQAFTYTPTINAGYPATGQVSLASGDLPDGLSLNPSTGAITGTPTGLAGPYAVTLTISNGVGTPAQLPVTITVNAGAVAAITLSPSAQTVDQGGALTFTVTAVDSAGNPTAVNAADIALTSSVTTDQISGLTVTFPHASPHTITATHVPTGATSSTTVSVTPAAAGADDDGLSGTGPTVEPTIALAIASALALLGTALVVGRSRLGAAKGRR